ncbi:CHCH domain containing protein [Trichuris trichiura]|uniref:CHCH domain containing protein n=1 Tax=Trichuris trichiura TaxID=36087 RepID=A0A077YYW2_TRITR|nr:CHCH domain containing protein [Trichuris trichiura]
MADDYDSSKDKIIFVTKEQQQIPLRPDVAALSISVTDDESGPVLPNGEINWNCPCLGDMVAGPCGYEFRQAFGCFHRSKADPRGSDCVEHFLNLHECVARYPGLFSSVKGSSDDESMADLMKGDSDKDEHQHLEKNFDSNSRAVIAAPPTKAPPSAD